MLEKDRMTGVRNMEIYWPDPLNPLIRTLGIPCHVFRFPFIAGCTCKPPAQIRSLGNERREKKDGELPGMGT